ncbi:MAG: hypothetical protein AVDCRST_MAG76-2220, partial [uncultured Acidimicrobiales bacterium]
HPRPRPLLGRPAGDGRALPGRLGALGRLPPPPAIGPPHLPAVAPRLPPGPPLRGRFLPRPPHLQHQPL